MSLSRRAFLLLSMALPCATAVAETHLVPKMHATIQEAVDAAGDGDTILISGGTYPESVVITNKTNLLVKAKGKVVIDPPGSADALVLDGCTGCTLLKLRATDAANGIHLIGCDNCSVLKCRVESVEGAGIVLDNCNAAVVEGCLVQDTGGDAFAVGLGAIGPSTDCEVRKNKALGAGDDGFDVSGSGNTLEKNLAVEAAGNGYRTEHTPPSASNSLTKNKSVKSHHNGFDIGGTDNVLTGNKDTQSATNGVALFNGSGHEVHGHKSTKPAAAGVIVSAGVSGATVDGCKIVKAGGNGVDVEADGATVTHNKCSSAGADGYVVAGDGGTWTGNAARGSQADGFDVTGVGSTLTFNKGHGSKDGFDLHDESAGGNSIDETNKFGTKSP